jgi:hypothetical protein
MGECNLTLSEFREGNQYKDVEAGRFKTLAAISAKIGVINLAVDFIDGCFMGAV